MRFLCSFFIWLLCLIKLKNTAPLFDHIPPGHYSPDGVRVFKCPIGYYSIGSNNLTISTCKTCSSGFTNHHMGSMSCLHQVSAGYRTHSYYYDRLSIDAKTNLRSLFATYKLQGSNTEVHMSTIKVLSLRHESDILSKHVSDFYANKYGDLFTSSGVPLSEWMRTFNSSFRIFPFSSTFAKPPADISLMNEKTVINVSGRYKVSVSKRLLHDESSNNILNMLDGDITSGTRLPISNDAANVETVFTSIHNTNAVISSRSEWIQIELSTSFAISGFMLNTQSCAKVTLLASNNGDKWIQVIPMIKTCSIANNTALVESNYSQYLIYRLLLLEATANSTALGQENWIVIDEFSLLLPDSRNNAYVTSWYSQTQTGQVAMQTDINCQPLYEIESKRIRFINQTFLVVSTGFLPSVQPNSYVINYEFDNFDSDHCLFGESSVALQHQIDLRVHHNCFHEITQSSSNHYCEKISPQGVLAVTSTGENHMREAYSYGSSTISKLTQFYEEFDKDLALQQHSMMFSYSMNFDEHQLSHKQAFRNHKFNGFIGRSSDLSENCFMDGAASFVATFSGSLVETDINVLGVMAVSTNQSYPCSTGSSIDGEVECKHSDPGIYISDGVLTKCRAGTYNLFRGAVGENFCSSCPAGTWSIAGASSCTPCQNDIEYGETVEATSCIAVPEGKFSKPSEVVKSFHCDDAGNQTFNVPAGILSLNVMLWGGGGGGGISYGGRAGDYTYCVLSVIPHEKLFVSVGCGGSAETNGGNSLIIGNRDGTQRNLVTALGGTGGAMIPEVDRKSSTAYCSTDSKGLGLKFAHSLRGKKGDTNHFALSWSSDYFDCSASKWINSHHMLSERDSSESLYLQENLTNFTSSMISNSMIPVSHIGKLLYASNLSGLVHANAVNNPFITSIFGLRDFTISCLIHVASSISSSLNTVINIFAFNNDKLKLQITPTHVTMTVNGIVRTQNVPWSTGNIIHYGVSRKADRLFLTIDGELLFSDEIGGVQTSINANMIYVGNVQPSDQSSSVKFYVELYDHAQFMDDFDISALHTTLAPWNTFSHPVRALYQLRFYDSTDKSAEYGATHIVPHSSFFARSSMDDFTVGLWVFNEIDHIEDSIYFTVFIINSHAHGIGLSVQSAGFSWTLNGGKYNYRSSTYAAHRKWTHYAISRYSGVLYFFLNGKDITTSMFPYYRNINNAEIRAGQIRLGTAKDGTNHFRGRLQHLEYLPYAKYTTSFIPENYLSDYVTKNCDVKVFEMTKIAHGGRAGVDDVKGGDGLVVIGHPSYPFPIGPSTFTPCPKGYEGILGRGGCLPCPMGKYSSAVGTLSGSCTRTSEGYYPSEDASEQVPCALNEYSPGGLTNCKPCAKGYYAPSLGSTACQQAPPGTFLPSHLSSPIDCPPGKFSLTGMISCINCPIGRYNTESRQSECEIVPDGMQTVSFSTLDSLSTDAKESMKIVLCSRLVNSAYDGPLFTLRINQITKNFYSDFAGNLGTAVNGSGISFLQWYNSHLSTHDNFNATVEKWYDQSGRNNHATQNIISLQPVYDVTTKKLLFNSVAYLILPKNALPSISLPYSIVAQLGRIIDYITPSNRYIFGGPNIALVWGKDLEMDGGAATSCKFMWYPEAASIFPFPNTLVVIPGPKQFIRLRKLVANLAPYNRGATLVSGGEDFAFEFWAKLNKNIQSVSNSSSTGQIERNLNRITIFSVGEKWKNGSVYFALVLPNTSGMGAHAEFCSGKKCFKEYIGQRVYSQNANCPTYDYGYEQQDLEWQFHAWVHYVVQRSSQKISIFVNGRRIDSICRKWYEYDGIHDRPVNIEEWTADQSIVSEDLILNPRLMYEHVSLLDRTRSALCSFWLSDFIFSRRAKYLETVKYFPLSSVIRGYSQEYRMVTKLYATKPAVGLIPHNSVISEIFNSTFRSGFVNGELSDEIRTTGNLPPFNASDYLIGCSPSKHRNTCFLGEISAIFALGINVSKEDQSILENASRKYRIANPTIASITFPCTKKQEYFYVPIDVEYIDIDVRGARGGDTDELNDTFLGGRVSARLSVIPNTKYFVHVGCRGGSSGFEGDELVGIGGYNGGGMAGQSQEGLYPGGGGGASDIRSSPLPSTRIIVAGGSGGFAGHSLGIDVGDFFVSSGAGSPGFNSDKGCSVHQAEGGQTHRGGIGAICTDTSAVGTVNEFFYCPSASVLFDSETALGGNGSIADGGVGGRSGGGGGGGWFGGGGGYYSSGAAGSNYCSPLFCSGARFGADSNSMDGIVTIRLSVSDHVKVSTSSGAFITFNDASIDIPAVQVSPCNSGLYSNSDGVCKPCAAGYYSSGGESRKYSKCIRVPNGYEAAHKLPPFFAPKIGGFGKEETILSSDFFNDNHVMVGDFIVRASSVVLGSLNAAFDGNLSTGYNTLDASETRGFLGELVFESCLNMTRATIDAYSPQAFMDDKTGSAQWSFISPKVNDLFQDLGKGIYALDNCAAHCSSFNATHVGLQAASTDLLNTENIHAAPIREFFCICLTNIPPSDSNHRQCTPCHDGSGFLCGKINTDLYALYNIIEADSSITLTTTGAKMWGEWLDITMPDAVSLIGYQLSSSATPSDVSLLGYAHRGDTNDSSSEVLALFRRLDSRQNSNSLNWFSSMGYKPYNALASAFKLSYTHIFNVTKGYQEFHRTIKLKDSDDFTFEANIFPVLGWEAWEQGLDTCDFDDNLSPDEQLDEWYVFGDRQYIDIFSIIALSEIPCSRKGGHTMRYFSEPTDNDHTQSLRIRLKPEALYIKIGSSEYNVPMPKDTFRRIFYLNNLVGDNTHHLAVSRCNGYVSVYLGGNNLGIFYSRDAVPEGYARFGFVTEPPVVFKPTSVLIADAVLYNVGKYCSPASKIVLTRSAEIYIVDSMTIGRDSDTDAFTYNINLDVHSNQEFTLEFNIQFLNIFSIFGYQSSSQQFLDLGENSSNNQIGITIIFARLQTSTDFLLESIVFMSDGEYRGQIRNDKLLSNSDGLKAVMISRCNGVLYFWLDKELIFSFAQSTESVIGKTITIKSHRNWDGDNFGIEVSNVQFMNIGKYCVEMGAFKAPTIGFSKNVAKRGSWNLLDSQMKMLVTQKFSIGRSIDRMYSRFRLVFNKRQTINEVAFYKSANSGATEVLGCASGYWSSGGRGGCKACGPGYYSLTTNGCATLHDGVFGGFGLNLAEAKPRGVISLYVPAESGANVTCAGGSKVDGGVVNWRYESFADGKNCMSCPRGTFSRTLSIPSSHVERSVTCINVPAGFYSNELNATGYYKCPTGTYSYEGSSQCTRIPVGSMCKSGSINSNFQEGIMQNAGIKSCIGFTLCEPGYYGEGNDSMCVMCPAGSYSLTFGAISCIPCEQFKYQDATGSTECKQVPAGFYASSSRITMNPSKWDQLSQSTRSRATLLLGTKRINNSSYFGPILKLGLLSIDCTPSMWNPSKYTEESTDAYRLNSSHVNFDREINIKYTHQSIEVDYYDDGGGGLFTQSDGKGDVLTGSRMNSYYNCASGCPRSCQTLNMRYKNSYYVAKWYDQSGYGNHLIRHPNEYPCRFDFAEDRVVCGYRSMESWRRSANMVGPAVFPSGNSPYSYAIKLGSWVPKKYYFFFQGVGDFDLEDHLPKNVFLGNDNFFDGITQSNSQAYTLDHNILPSDKLSGMLSYGITCWSPNNTWVADREQTKVLPWTLRGQSSADDIIIGTYDGRDEPSMISESYRGSVRFGSAILEIESGPTNVSSDFLILGPGVPYGTIAISKSLRSSNRIFIEMSSFSRITINGDFRFQNIVRVPGRIKAYINGVLIKEGQHHMRNGVGGSTKVLFSTTGYALVKRGENRLSIQPGGLTIGKDIDIKVGSIVSGEGVPAGARVTFIFGKYEMAVNKAFPEELHYSERQLDFINTIYLGNNPNPMYPRYSNYFFRLGFNTFRTERDVVSNYDGEIVDDMFTVHMLTVFANHVLTKKERTLINSVYSIDHPPTAVGAKGFWKCPVGTTSRVSPSRLESECRIISAGSFGGTWWEQQCPPGFFCPFAGMSLPMQCPVGKYSVSFGSTACSPFDAGKQYFGDFTTSNMMTQGRGADHVRSYYYCNPSSQNLNNLPSARCACVDSKFGSCTLGQTYSLPQQSRMGSVTLDKVELRLSNIQGKSSINILCGMLVFGIGILPNTKVVSIVSHSVFLSNTARNTTINIHGDKFTFIDVTDHIANDNIVQFYDIYSAQSYSMALKTTRHGQDDCPPGTYNPIDNAGLDECLMCSPGKFRVSAGGLSCEDCSAFGGVTVGRNGDLNVPPFIGCVFPTGQPTGQPSRQPSNQPSCQPSSQPSHNPTTAPSRHPSSHPSCRPTHTPTAQPSRKPSGQPSGRPSSLPTLRPTSQPTSNPTLNPTINAQDLFQFASLPDTSFKVVNLYAFAVINKDGGVITWGDPKLGGDSSSVQQHISSGVKLLVAGQHSFAALKHDGSVYSWGAYSTPSVVSAAKLGSGVISLVANEYAYAALKNDSSVVTFGHPRYGGDISNPTVCNSWDAASLPLLNRNVSFILATAGAFAALKTDGSVVAWGDREAGGGMSTIVNLDLFGIERVFSNRAAFAALHKSGSVITWGSKLYGAVLKDRATIAENGVAYIYSNMRSFAALHRNREISAWGDRSVGGYWDSYSTDAISKPSALPASSSSSKLLPLSALTYPQTSNPVSMSPSNSNMHVSIHQPSSPSVFVLKDLVSLVPALKLSVGTKLDNIINIKPPTYVHGGLTGKFVVDVSNVYPTQSALVLLDDNPNTFISMKSDVDYLPVTSHVMTSNGLTSLKGEWIQITVPVSSNLIEVAIDVPEIFDVGNQPAMIWILGTNSLSPGNLDGSGKDAMTSWTVLKRQANPDCQQPVETLPPSPQLAKKLFPISAFYKYEYFSAANCTGTLLSEEIIAIGPCLTDYRRDGSFKIPKGTSSRFQIISDDIGNLHGKEQFYSDPFCTINATNGAAIEFPFESCSSMQGTDGSIKYVIASFPSLTRPPSTISGRAEIYYEAEDDCGTSFETRRKVSSQNECTIFCSSCGSQGIPLWAKFGKCTTAAIEMHCPRVIYSDSRCSQKVDLEEVMTYFINNCQEHDDPSNSGSNFQKISNYIAPVTQKGAAPVKCIIGIDNAPSFRTHRVIYRSKRTQELLSQPSNTTESKLVVVHISNIGLKLQVSNNYPNDLNSSSYPANAAIFKPHFILGELALPTIRPTVRSNAIRPTAHDRTQVPTTSTAPFIFMSKFVSRGTRTKCATSVGFAVSSKQSVDFLEDQFMADQYRAGRIKNIPQTGRVFVTFHLDNALLAALQLGSSLKFAFKNDGVRHISKDNYENPQMPQTSIDLLLVGIFSKPLTAFDSWSILERQSSASKFIVLKNIQDIPIDQHSMEIDIARDSLMFREILSTSPGSYLILGFSSNALIKDLDLRQPIDDYGFVLSNLVSDYSLNALDHDDWGPYLINPLHSDELDWIASESDFTLSFDFSIDHFHTFGDSTLVSIGDPHKETFFSLSIDEIGMVSLKVPTSKVFRASLKQLRCGYWYNFVLVRRSGYLSGFLDTVELWHFLNFDDLRAKNIIFYIGCDIVDMDRRLFGVVEHLKLRKNVGHSPLPIPARMSSQENGVIKPIIFSMMYSYSLSSRIN